MVKAMPLHIGIVACSAEGAALCYRTICADPRHHPEVSMHTHPLSAYMRHINAGDWDGVGELMLLSAKKLEAVGADILICPDNTIHQALARIEGRSPLPWFHITDVVASEAHARGFHRLGLTGTQWLIESDLYPEKLAKYSIDVMRPDAKEKAEMNRIIMEELVRGIVKPASLFFFQQLIARFQRDGCDGVILGCTEIPLIIDDKTSPLPTLDSTRLLAWAALRMAAAAG